MTRKFYAVCIAFALFVPAAHAMLAQAAQMLS